MPDANTTGSDTSDLAPPGSARPDEPPSAAPAAAVTAASGGPAAVVHEVRWADALPWWLLFRAAAAAFSPTVILLATLGGLGTWAGWSAIDQLGLPNAIAGGISAADADARGLSVADGLTHDSLAHDRVLALRPSRGLFPWLGAAGRRLPVIRRVLDLVALPLTPAADGRQVAGAAARIGWFLLVWSIFGTAICRHVALRLVGEDAPGPIAATAFGSHAWISAFTSVLFVLAGMLVLSIPGAVLGLAMRTDWGLAFAGAVWPLVLLGAIVLAILAIGVAAGWPLMVATIGVERGDSFQAISTSFSYLYQRPLHYAFYLLVAGLVAVPAFAAAALFADATTTLAAWATSLGMGRERTALVLDALARPGSTPELTAAGSWGLEAMSFWVRGVRTLLASFGWGYFWAITTAAYLLLRQDVDGTELDEVVLDEPSTSA
jgi:hypothetical protein